MRKSLPARIEKRGVSIGKVAMERRQRRGMSIGKVAAIAIRVAA
jgi:hypothetical protein